MRRLLAAVAALLAACVPRAATAMDEVPFIASPDNVTLEMLRIADVGPQDYVIDLGSGDGRIVIVAARRFGARGLGVEYVPDLVRKSNENAARAGVEHRARFLKQDLFDTDLSAATVVTLYLLTEVNLQLRPRLLALAPGTRVVSHDWDMGEWKPDRTVTVDVPDKQVGLEKSSRIHLWIVPARVAGTWCGRGRLQGTRLDLEQRFQTFHAALTHDGLPRTVDGRIAGALLDAAADEWELGLESRGDTLRVVRASGRMAALRGGVLARAPDGACS